MPGSLIKHTIELAATAHQIDSTGDLANHQPGDTLDCPRLFKNAQMRRWVLAPEWGVGRPLGHLGVDSISDSNDLFSCSLIMLGIIDLAVRESFLIAL